MRKANTQRRILGTLLLLAASFSVTACTGPTSVDQAYYTGGDAFSFSGGYNRTIFSPSNF